MKVSDIKQSKVNRTLSALGAESIPCDICGVDLVRDDVCYRAKIRDSYLNTSASICVTCFENRGDKSPEELFIQAMENRAKIMQSILDNAHSLNGEKHGMG